MEIGDVEYVPETPLMENNMDRTNETRNEETKKQTKEARHSPRLSNGMDNKLKSMKMDNNVYPYSNDNVMMPRKIRWIAL